MLEFQLSPQGQAFEHIQKHTFRARILLKSLPAHARIITCLMEKLCYDYVLQRVSLQLRVLKVYEELSGYFESRV